MLLGLISVIGVGLAFGRVFFRAEQPLVSKVPRFHGKTIDSVLEELEEPDRIYDFTMPTQGELDEFRIELHNTYPPNNPANASIKIKELTWRDGEYRLTVWFHRKNGKWIALDTCQYHDSIAF